MHWCTLPQRFFQQRHAPTQPNRCWDTISYNFCVTNTKLNLQFTQVISQITLAISLLLHIWQLVLAVQHIWPNSKQHFNFLHMVLYTTAHCTRSKAHTVQYRTATFCTMNHTNSTAQRSTTVQHKQFFFKVNSLKFNHISKVELLCH